MKKILITGPESTGKSFLTKRLSDFFEGSRVDEFAREYLLNRPKYIRQDLLEIAKGQYANEMKAFCSNAKMVFCDTGIEVVCVWSQVKYHSVDPEITKLLDLKKYDLILLCQPNVPWVFDELREHPYNRDIIYQQYIDLLNAQDVKFKVINESVDNRFDQACGFVNEII